MNMHRLMWVVVVAMAWLTIHNSLSAAHAQNSPVLELQADQTDLDVVIRIANLPELRQQYQQLKANIQLAGLETTFTAALTAPAQTPAIMIRKDDPAWIDFATVELWDGDVFLLRDKLEISRIHLEAPRLPLLGTVAHIEPGQGLTDQPAVRQPDLLRLPSIPLSDSPRIVSLNDISVPVIADVNFPLVSSNNNCVISRQTAYPKDPTRRSIYVPLKSQLFNAAGQPNLQLHYLAEIPIDPAWITLESDKVTLDPASIKIHVTDKVGGKGKLITGQGDGGLGQLIGAAAVDDEGNLYYSASIDNSMVRFNIAKARFEEPPLDVLAAMNRALPDKRYLPAEYGHRVAGWDPIMYVQVAGDRVYLAPHRFDILTNQVMLNGVVSFPLKHWYNARAFAAGMKLLATSAPGHPRSLYERWPKIEEPTWKIAPPVHHDHAIYTTSYPPPVPMGPWRINDEDRDGARPVEVITFKDVQQANQGSKPMLSTTAIRLFDWVDYGLLKTTRARIKQALVGGDISGDDERELLIYYDPLAAMSLNPRKFSVILQSQRGPALAPCYMATAIPGRPGMLLGVAEYGYYLAEFDLTTLAQGHVTKRYLKLDLGDESMALPVKVGIGPYGRLWWPHEDEWHLVVTGYTGVSTMLYSKAGQVLPRHHVTLKQFQNKRDLDGTPSGPSMTHTYPLHGLNQRIHMLATNSASRSGNPYSNGLQTFSLPEASELLRLSHMTRGAGNGWLRSRLIIEPDGRQRQQLFLAGGMSSPVYLEMLQGKDLPTNQDAKLFFYDCGVDSDPVDVMGISLPVVDSKSGVSGQVISPDGRYLISLQQGRLLSFDLTRCRYVDGYRLHADVWEFTRPDERFNVAPNGSIFFCAREGDAPKVTFYELEVSPTGMIAIHPRLTLWTKDANSLRPLAGGIIAFVPDVKQDGSYDLCLGPWSRMPGSLLRVVPDFIPASPVR